MPNDFTHTYIYDLVGNRLERQVTDGNTTYYYYDANTDELTQEITDDANTFYYYDENGSLIEEANDAGTVYDYTYNYRNRLDSVTYGGTTVDYAYNPDGIRVQADDGTNLTNYLIDPYNHTGYAQVFKEKVTVGETTTETVYIAGLDILAQATSSNAPKYLLYDGHGSVRHLANTSGAITESYSYDAYGVMLGGNPTSTSPAATNMLYAGEQFDTGSQQYYLRARYYDQNTGRFNRMDPFPGSPSHKIV